MPSKAGLSFLLSVALKILAGQILVILKNSLIVLKPIPDTQSL